jgi:hypothetical protein
MKIKHGIKHGSWGPLPLTTALLRVAQSPFYRYGGEALNNEVIHPIHLGTKRVDQDSNSELPGSKAYLLPTTGHAMSLFFHLSSTTAWHHGPGL